MPIWVARMFSVIENDSHSSDVYCGRMVTARHGSLITSRSVKGGGFGMSSSVLPRNRYVLCTANGKTLTPTDRPLAY